MVADAVIYHPTVAHYLKFVATTVGRDKVLRTLQYFARFYAWYLYRTNNPPAAIAPWEAMKKQFGLTRKIMRIGKFVEHFKAASQAADAKSMDPILKFCVVGRQLGYAGYMTFDCMTVLDATGIRKSSTAARIGREAYKAWLTGLAFSVLSSVYTLYMIRQRTLSINKQEGEKAVEAKKLEQERKSTTIQLVSDLCDMTVPSTALGLTSFDEGIVGLAGTVSSLIGVWSTWKKTA